MKRLTLSICFAGLLLNFGVGIPFAAETAVNASREQSTVQYPLKNCPDLSLGFGSYNEDKDGFHGGVDIRASLNTQVYPIARGKVVTLTQLGSEARGNYLGWLIAIEHKGRFIIPARFDAVVMPDGTTKAYKYERSEETTMYSIYVHVKPTDELRKQADLQPEVLPTEPIAMIEKTIYGPHLHFEIRLPNAQHSPNNWSMVGSSTNWRYVFNPKTGKWDPNGYYIDLQAMVDAGLRDPIDFIKANETPQTLAQACWKEYKIGDLFYSVPEHWKPGPETKDGVRTRMYHTEQGQTTFMIGVGDSLVKDYEPGKLRIVHYGMDGGEKIEESATASRTITIGHMGRLVGGFSRVIAGRPVTVCILRLSGNDNRSLENWSFALIENGKQYALSLISGDRSFQSEIFAELVSRIHF